MRLYFISYVSFFFLALGLSHANAQKAATSPAAQVAAAPGGAAPGAAAPAAEAPGAAAAGGGASAENCWLSPIQGLACGVGASFSLNLSNTSVTAYKVVAVTGGHVVQPTSSYNNIAGLIAYAAVPGLDAVPDYTKPSEYLRCGPVFVWLETNKCGPFATFTIPGTTGGIQQYGLGWRTQVYESTPDPNAKTTEIVSIGVAASYSSEVPSLDPNIVAPNGMVYPQYDAAVAAGTLLPTRTSDRWGIMFVIGVGGANTF